MVIKAEDIFYEQGISGTTKVLDRPQFVKLLGHYTVHKIKKILIEDCRATCNLQGLGSNAALKPQGIPMGS